MTYPVSVIGMGMSPKDLTEHHLEIIRSAHVLVGGSRHLAPFADLEKETRTVDRHLPELVAFIRRRMADQKVVVLASGDPLYYGIGAYLVKALGSDALRFYPNINAVASAFARLGEPWQGVPVVSLHGRDNVEKIARALQQTGRAAVFTDNRRSPSWLGKRLSQMGWPDLRICVLEQMGYPEEKVEWYTPAEAADRVFSEPNLAVLTAPSQRVKTDPALWIGMPEERFIHEAGLITKAEVRAVTMSKLRLGPGQVLWDLGAGSGAIGIEASALIPGGRVIAVEKNKNRLEQIRQNRTSHGVTNLEVVEARLPDGIADLPAPDRVFIGGGGKSLASILEQTLPRMRPGGILVINTVLLSSLEVARQTLENAGMAPGICQIQVSRGKPMSGGLRFQAENPVWIVSSRKDPVDG